MSAIAFRLRPSDKRLARALVAVAAPALGVTTGLVGDLLVIFTRVGEVTCSEVVRLLFHNIFDIPSEID